LNSFLLTSSCIFKVKKSRLFQRSLSQYQ
jgi:hypothetical protein